MVDPTKRPKLVGNFIRERREAAGLSQRALGLMFNPAVTTQFISNVERGVTPLPPSHIPTLVKALNVSDEEITVLLEKEYTLKLSGRLGKSSEELLIGSGSSVGSGSQLAVSQADLNFMRSLYEAYKQADTKTKQTFASVCESILNLPSTKKGGAEGGSQPQA